MSICKLGLDSSNQPSFSFPSQRFKRVDIPIIHSKRSMNIRTLTKGMLYGTKRILGGRRCLFIASANQPTNYYAIENKYREVTKISIDYRYSPDHAQVGIGELLATVTSTKINFTCS